MTPEVGDVDGWTEKGSSSAAMKEEDDEVGVMERQPSEPTETGEEGKPEAKVRTGGETPAEDGNSGEFEGIVDRDGPKRLGPYAGRWEMETRRKWRWTFSARLDDHCRPSN